MRDKEGYTPKSKACSIVYDAIYAELRSRNRETSVSKFDSDVEKYLRKIGYKLLESGKLDGTPLPERG